MANNTETNDERRSRVLALLSEALPKDTQGLMVVLCEAEACFIGIVTARLEAQSKLHSERLRLRHPKDKEYTDWDRKIMLDANTAAEQAEYDLFVAMEKALEQRISIIQTLLSC